MNIAALIDQALRTAGIPIISVTVGNDDDRSTWRVEFAPEATDQQKADAAALLESIDVSPEALAESKLQYAMSNDKLVRAVIIWMAAKVNVSPQDARTQIATIYRNL